MSKPAFWQIVPLALCLVGVISVVGEPVARPQLGAAIADQQRLIEERPNDANAHSDLGNLLVLAGRSRDAVKVYERALEINADHRFARYNLGLLWLEDGNDKAAESQFQLLIESDPGDAWSHYQLGTIYEERRQRSLAVESYARAFALDPELTFAEVNPHIIDNTYFSEALLKSQKKGGSARRLAPRAYHEASRIEALMAESAAPEAAAAPGEAAIVESGSPTAGSPVAFDETGAPAVRTREATPSSADGPENSSVANGGGVPLTPRVIGVEDLDPDSNLGRTSTPGGVIGTGSRGRSSFSSRNRGVDRGSSSANVRRRSSTSRSDGRGDGRGDATGAAGNAASGRIGGYRPRRSSTGRLDLRLLPAEEPAERVAALDAIAGSGLERN